ncbi:Chemotaxis regulator - transmits chemoreceptor signals to flagelllar motor components CheY [Paramagnetospirillum magnetotacticum MS-1]|uniref:Chemotaxis regulator-transmits chemoreceptor signals to flagelllar motor components CheY n=2 Tax=Paramagnetospirillum magnetotacticum TaxID=188 RepID=A0A0C2U5F4_PARME|nr:Chemotaxis regulator - transmits chemoreceptor signals to flagelllar motor components CheY [Paramagnetospirillum magnetotacticum MS-1]
MRTLIKVVLHQLGVAEIVEAEDGNEALQVLREGGADLVVMDWMMPGMDGIECTRRIRAGQDGIVPSIPIIVATGVQGDGAESMALAAGANCFLKKPFSIKRLHAAFEMVLGESAASMN